MFVHCPRLGSNLDPVTSEACSWAVLCCVHVFHTCLEEPQSSQVVLAMARAQEELGCHKNNLTEYFYNMLYILNFSS